MAVVEREFNKIKSETGIPAKKLLRFASFLEPEYNVFEDIIEGWDRIDEFIRARGDNQPDYDFDSEIPKESDQFMKLDENEIWNKLNVTSLSQLIWSALPDRDRPLVILAPGYETEWSIRRYLSVQDGTLCHYIIPNNPEQSKELEILVGFRPIPALPVARINSIDSEIPKANWPFFESHSILSEDRKLLSRISQPMPDFYDGLRLPTRRLTHHYHLKLGVDQQILSKEQFNCETERSDPILSASDLLRVSGEDRSQICGCMLLNQLILDLDGDDMPVDHLCSAKETFDCFLRFSAEEISSSFQSFKSWLRSPSRNEEGSITMRE